MPRLQNVVGKQLEDDIRDAHKFRGLYCHNSNDPTPELDKTACYMGMSIRIECKSTSGRSLPFCVAPGKKGLGLTINERKVMARHANAGGLSLLIVEDATRDQCWAIEWGDLVRLVAYYAGTEWCRDVFLDRIRWPAPTPLHSPDKPRISLPLGDLAVSGVARQLHRVTRRDFRGNSLGSVYDLRPVYRAAYRARFQHEAPQEDSHD